jgi:hypothetical protein
MSAIPVWIWALSGGLLLGPLGLLILWPGCSRGALSLMKRFTISILLKLVLAGIGFYVALKYLRLPVEQLVYGFFAGYTISLILEISICAWKVRKCAQNISSPSSSSPL